MYKAEPGTEVSGVNPDDGSVIGPFTFGKNGTLDVPDDYQEAHKLLLDAGLEQQKRTKESD